MDGSTTITVQRLPRGYRAVMRIVTPHGTGTRVIEDSRCDRLADDVLLVLALSVEQAPLISAPPRWTVALLMSAAHGVTPSLALGATAALALEWSWLRVELHGTYHAPQSARLGDSPLTARFQLLSGGLRTGVVFALGRFDLAPSIGVAALHYFARGEGGALSRSDQMISWGPAAGLLLRLSVSARWAIVSAADGVVCVLRPRFVFSDAGTLYQAPSFALRAWLGLELRL